MQYNSFGVNAWQQFWRGRIDSGLAGIYTLQAQSEKRLFPCSPSQKDHHVILPPPSKDAQSHKKSSQEKRSPLFYFFWIQLVLKHLETKTTSVVLVAVCEQRSAQYFSLSPEQYIFSLTAVQEVKFNE